MRIAVIGRTELLYDCALRLHNGDHRVVCIITAKESPESKRSVADFKELAEEWQIPFWHSSNIENLSDLLHDAKADIAVSVNYTSVVPQSVIDLFPLGILNAHGGDLPRYRGNACQAWAILNGEDRIGLCIHKMVGDKLDSGDIVARDYMPIDHATKITRVWEWMSVRTPELMAEAVEILKSDPTYILEKQTEDPRLALRCYPRQPEDGRIDWTRSAINVLRLINASNKPYTGAYSVFQGKRLTIWDAELVEDDEVFCAVPGQLVGIGREFVEIACGAGKIRLLSVEYAGSIETPSNILKSIRMRLS